MISPIKKPALAGTGGINHQPSRSYPVTRASASAIGARLSPRRKLYAQRLLDHLCWHGRKILLDDRTYADVLAERGLDRFAVNQAVDDLFALGLVDVRLAGNDIQVVKALAGDLDGAA